MGATWVFLGQAESPQVNQQALVLQGLDPALHDLWFPSAMGAHHGTGLVEEN